MQKNNSDKSLGYAIGKTNWYLKTLISKMLRDEECGITNEQWLVLKAVAANPALSQTELAQKTQKEKTNITRIIDLLEKGSFIERRRDEHDRRMYRIYATDKGLEILERVNPITQKIEDICIQTLDKKQIEDIIHSLDAVCERMKKDL